MWPTANLGLSVYYYPLSGFVRQVACVSELLTPPTGQTDPGNKMGIACQISHILYVLRFCLSLLIALPHAAIRTCGSVSHAYSPSPACSDLPAPVSLSSSLEELKQFSLLIRAIRGPRRTSSSTNTGFVLVGSVRAGPGPRSLGFVANAPTIEVRPSPALLPMDRQLPIHIILGGGRSAVKVTPAEKLPYAQPLGTILPSGYVVSDTSPAYADPYYQSCPWVSQLRCLSLSHCFHFLSHRKAALGTLADDLFLASYSISHFRSPSLWSPALLLNAGPRPRG